MGLLGIAWVIVIVLKIAGLAFVATSWAWVILWPLIPAVILIVLGLLGLVAANSLTRF